MALTLTGRLQDPFGNALEDAGVRFRSARTSTQVLANYVAETTTDSNGDYTITVQYGVFHIEARQSNSEPWYTIARSIPITVDTTSTDINSLIVAYLGAGDATPDIVLEIEAITATATTAASDAETSAQRAESAANDRAISADSTTRLSEIASLGGAVTGQEAVVKGTIFSFDGASFSPVGAVNSATFDALSDAISSSDGVDITKDESVSDQSVSLSFIGNNSRKTLTVSQNDASGLTLARQDSRLGQRRLSGIRVSGDDNQNLSGTNRIGIYDLGTLNAKIDTLYARNCKYGMLAERTMELNISDALFQRNEVGFLLRPHPDDGGGNANSYYSTRYQTNIVGLAFYIPSGSTRGMSSNLFYGGLLQENTRQAVALINKGDSVIENVVFDGFHIEGNNDDKASSVVEGVTVPACIFYVENSNATISNTKFLESTGEMPCVLAENGATLVMHNISGYGSVAGVFMEADDTSRIYETGLCHLIGRRYGLYSYGHPTMLTQKTFVLGRNTTLSPSREIPNQYSGANLDPMAPEGFGSPSTVEALVNGQNTREITFAASAGDSSTNRWATQTSPTSDTTAYRYVSLLIRSDRDASFRGGLRGAGNDSDQDFSLFAGKWYRLVSIIEAVNTTSTNFFLWPTDSAGAVVNITGFMARPTDDFDEIAKMYSENTIDIMSGSL